LGDYNIAEETKGGEDIMFISTDGGYAINLDHVREILIVATPDNRHNLVALSSCDAFRRVISTHALVEDAKKALDRIINMTLSSNGIDRAFMEKFAKIMSFATTVGTI